MTPIAAQRRKPEDSTHREPIPRPKSEYKISAGAEPKPHAAVQRNRSIGSGDYRSTRPPAPPAPSSHPAGTSAPTSKPRSCPPTPAPRRDVKSCLVKDPEVQGIDLQMAAPARSRKSLRTTTDKQGGVISSTTDTSHQLDQRRSSSEFEANTVAPHKGEMRTAPVVGVATKMASPRPSQPAPGPPSASGKPTMLSGTSGVTPQE